MSNSVDKWLANIINLSDLPETDRLIFGKIRKRANQLIKEGNDPCDVMVEIFQGAINEMTRRNLED